MPLKVSDRLKLLKEVSERLCFEEWYMVDITLKEFGLPTETIWNGEKTAYILEMTSNASANVLIELGRHLGFELSNQKTGVVVEECSFWHPGMFKLFVSHLASERQFAGDFQKHLLQCGISCFVAHNDITPTKEWQVEIEAALRTCDSLVALLHNGFHASSWTDQEIGFVMGRELPAFAVRLGETPYGFIARFQAFNGLGKKAEQIAKELFEAYRQHPLTKAAMASVCVALFESSDSFEQAKTRVRYLEEIESWEPAFSERVISALKTNNQISGSFGVPARVNALVSAHKT